MYAKPALRSLDLGLAEASCCRIMYDDNVQIRTPLCPFPTCGPAVDQDIIPCTITVGPVTISGT